MTNRRTRKRRRWARRRGHGKVREVAGHPTSLVVIEAYRSNVGRKVRTSSTYQIRDVKEDSRYDVIWIEPDGTVGR
jgi:hypothetical protein